MKKIFYNVSLPRSGSTLLQNILAQNPNIYATPTSGLYELIEFSKEVYTKRPEFAAQDVDIMNNAFSGYCKGAIDGFCKGLSNKEYVIDKSFHWTTSFKLLETIYKEKPKMVIMVRDLRDIFASMEEGYRNTQFKIHPSVKWDLLECTTLKKRIQYWSASIPLGSSLDRLKELINCKNDKDVFFIKYEDFCSYPNPIMISLYKYFNIEFYRHDFNKIKQVTDQNDSYYMFSHKIKEQLKPIPSQAIEILGKGLCDSISEEYDWYFKYFNYTK
jgi:sulfotransferase